MERFLQLNLFSKKAALSLVGDSNSTFYAPRYLNICIRFIAALVKHVQFLGLPTTSWVYSHPKQLQQLQNLLSIL